MGENRNNPAVCESFREFGYYGIRQLAVPVDEPHWGLGREGFRRDPRGHRSRGERDLPRELDRRVLLEMGLVRQCEVVDGEATVVVRVTHPSCMMAPVFLARVQQLAGELPWTEADMTAEYRERLARRRAGG
jgi:Iron-sulfur cluster assembly protein